MVRNIVFQRNIYTQYIYEIKEKEKVYFKNRKLLYLNFIMKIGYDTRPRICQRPGEKIHLKAGNMLHFRHKN